MVCNNFDCSDRFDSFLHNLRGVAAGVADLSDLGNLGNARGVAAGLADLSDLGNLSNARRVAAGVANSGDLGNLSNFRNTVRMNVAKAETMIVIEIKVGVIMIKKRMIMESV